MQTTWNCAWAAPQASEQAPSIAARHSWQDKACGLQTILQPCQHVCLLKFGDICKFTRMLETRFIGRVAKSFWELLHANQCKICSGSRKDPGKACCGGTATSRFHLYRSWTLDGLYLHLHHVPANIHSHQIYRMGLGKRSPQGARCDFFQDPFRRSGSALQACSTICPKIPRHSLFSS